MTDTYDPMWTTNVGPLLDALKRLNLDPVEWAEDHDLEVILQEVGLRNADLILFACGYMQATGNLTGQAWSEQMARYV